MFKNKEEDFNREKFKEVILYLISKSPTQTLEGKKKLAKLLYFVDFNFFEEYEEPVTGAHYRALPMGPVPDELDEVLKEMRGKEVRIGKKDIGLENDMEVFSLNKKNEITFNNITSKEKKVIDKVFKDYGILSGKILENITHSEPPYNAVAKRELIPYELSFYRNKSREELVGS